MYFTLISNFSIFFFQQTDLQNRPPHFYPEKRPTSTEQMKPQTERTEEYVPTGAIEYHNPLNLKLKQNDRPVVSSIQTQKFNEASSNQDVKPEKTQETWYSGTQTEKTLDSESDASEPVKYHNQVKEVEKYDKTKGDTSLINDHNNDTSSNKNSYVASDNTMVGKIGEIDSQQDQKKKPIWINPFAHKNEDVSIQTQYGPNYYNSKPYETPIVQGKPFGVYTGHEESNYGYKETSEYDIVQGVPSTYYGNKVLQISHKNQQNQQTSTPSNREHDDTIDLKPPAIIPQFVPELDKPNRPYPRPTIVNKVETRPVLYSKPEIIGQTSEVRPDHVNRLNESKPDTSEQQFGNNSLSYSEKLNQSHFQLGGFMDLNWENEMKAGDKRQEILVNRSEIMKNHYRNSSISHQMESQYPPQTSINPVKLEKNHAVIIQQDYSSATKIHPEYPHIVTKPKPQVPGPITISTANNKPDTRPNIRFSLPVEAIGEEMDSKTQTERPPSMLITTNNSSDKKKNTEKIDTSYHTNFATQDANKDDSMNHESKIRIRPIETSTGDMLTNMEGMNVPSRDMMPPPLRPVIGLNQSNKNEEEDLKPPPIPSRDVVGLSPPPVDITTTNSPTEDRFSFVTANESGLKPPPKYIPLKESSVAPLPSVSMVPPSPRPSLTRPFIVELLSQVNLLC